jgi:hypothetical protein
MPRAVGGGEARDELQRNIGGTSHRDRPAFDDGAQRLALEKFGDQKGKSPVPMSKIARMLAWDSGGDGARFLLEAMQPRRVARRRTGQYFDRDVAAEPRVARLVDFTHATGAERRHDFVRAEAHARSQGHQAIVLHRRLRLAAVDELLLDRLGLVDLAEEGLEIVFHFRAGARVEILHRLDRATACPCACRGILATLSNSSTVRQGPRYIRSTTLRRPRRRSGMAYGGCTKPEISKSYGTTNSLRSGILDEAHVVERPDRHVGVADHVFEQHRPRQRFGFEVGERDALQVDDSSLRYAARRRFRAR